MNDYTKLTFSSEYLNFEDTFNCGQIFRFKPFNKGFLVFSEDKCAYCFNESKNAYVYCEPKDEKYFYNFFDYARDYSKIYNNAISSQYEFVKKCAIKGKGIRILNQNNLEMIYSFIISQNNNIPRIKKIIEALCQNLGQKKNFFNEEYFSFPNVKDLAVQNDEFYKNAGLGYRASYVKKLSTSIINGEIKPNDFTLLSTNELKKALLNIYGIGPKVCDCVSFFGYHRSDSFPVDTWIEKVYKENFNGKLTNNKKISEWFINLFKENSGYIQQYLFYYKRSLEKKEKTNKNNII